MTGWFAGAALAAALARGYLESRRRRLRFLGWWAGRFQCTGWPAREDGRCRPPRPGSSNRAGMAVSGSPPGGLLLITAALGAGIAFQFNSLARRARTCAFADLVALPNLSSSRCHRTSRMFQWRWRACVRSTRQTGGQCGSVCGLFRAASIVEPCRNARSQGQRRIVRAERRRRDGRFHFRFATSELTRRAGDARPAVMAIASGYGPDWAEIGPSAAGDLKLQLVDDLPVSGRVLDPDRNPIAGAKLVVQAIYSAPVDELARFLKGDINGWAPRCWKGPLPGNAPTVITDVDGRWRCGGLGRDRIAAFALKAQECPDDAQHGNLAWEITSRDTLSSWASVQIT